MNQYSRSEVYEFHTRRGPDGTFYPVTLTVIGYRHKINGHPVKPDGTPENQKG